MTRSALLTLAIIIVLAIAIHRALPHLMAWLVTGGIAS